MDAKNRIEMAKLNLRKAENAKIQADTQHEAAERSLKEVVEKMLEYNVTPETIEAEIQKIEASINADLDSIEKLIPEV